MSHRTDGDHGASARIKLSHLGESLEDFGAKLVDVIQFLQTQMEQIKTSQKNADYLKIAKDQSPQGLWSKSESDLAVQVEPEYLNDNANIMMNHLEYLKSESKFIMRDNAIVNMLLDGIYR